MKFLLNLAKKCFPGFFTDDLLKAPRSSKWPEVRAYHLARFPQCTACGNSEDLEVHHIIPVHVNRMFELEQSNLITLCPRCHLLFGHLCNWTSYNTKVEEDAEVMYQKVRRRP